MPGIGPYIISPIVQHGTNMNLYGDFTIIGKNKFNKALAEVGKEMYATGALGNEANSITSPLIPIDSEVKLIVISGLTPYTGTAGVYCWYDVNQTFISYGNMAVNLTEIAILKPNNAAFLRHNISRRKTGSEVINLDTIQTEWWEKTAYEAYSSTVQSLVIDPSDNLPKYTLTPGKNKFSKHKYLPGYETTTGTGAIGAYSTSSSTSYIPIPTDARFVYLSGFTVYTGTNRLVNFYDVNKAFISYSQILASETAKSIAIPSTAKYVIVEIVKRKTGAETINLDTIQIEFYGQTDYEAYNETLVNQRLLPLHDTKVWGLKIIGAGDSIMQTATWSADGTTYTEGTRENWLTMAAGYLKLGVIRNYGQSGGRWKDEEQTALLKVSQQVTTAIANNATTDIVVMNCGVNDGDLSTNLGSFATAMSKATLADLDRSLFYEALRWGMWSIRTAYPTAKCFAGGILDNASHPNSYYAVHNAAIAAMCAEYGFYFVDQTQALINTTTDLADGLHPNNSGWRKIGKFWEAQILARF